ncbi:hypothetical protein [Pantoea sp.]|uniref:hypothetical protein n=1 Tax=Pantoea sp. TaxID=69393 RepID=UPI00290FDADE|nr:hypothetical protein [Pantoea sp.]MDU4128675.1 hypothetical protein [Pantoea sp.]
MKERPIIFNADMVRAVLDGRKTQTRRIMRVQPDSAEFETRFIIDSTKRSEIGKWCWAEPGVFVNPRRSALFSCPFGAVGDRLWVRETFATLGNEDGCAIDWDDNLVKGGGREAAHIYRASCEQRPRNYGLWSIPDDAFWKPHTDNMQYEGAWVPSIHMPRWASRITLEVTGVRVERLRDISEKDAAAEGVPPAGDLLPDYPGTYLTSKGDFATAKVAFQRLWESIYKEESWQANPWVWVVEFKRVEGE